MQDNIFRKNMKQWFTQMIHKSMPVMRKQSGHGGLSMSQFGTLGIVIERESSTVSEIAQEMGISNAAASQVIDKLVQMDMLIRTEDPNDRRVKKIKITEKGKDFMHRKFKDRINKLMLILDAMTDDEMLVVQEAFKIVKEKIKVIENMEK